MKTYDCVVLGAGPAGLTAALYLCRFGLNIALVEKLTPGGQMLSTFEITNYLGSPQGLSGWELAEKFAQHLEGFTLDRFAQGAKKLSRRDNLYTIELESETIEARTIIVCSGASPRKLGLPGEERLIGKGISYCAMCDGMFFKNKIVAMVGGGNSALEEAQHLSNLVEKLYLIHRRDHFRADKIYRDRLLANPRNIETILSHVVTELHGDNALTGITIAPTDGGASRLLEVNGLFVFIGHVPAGEYLPPDLTIDGQGFIVTDSEMCTNLPGVFAAGDIRAKQCRQVVTAVGDGATAAYSAFQYIERNKK